MKEIDILRLLLDIVQEARSHTYTEEGDRFESELESELKGRIEAVSSSSTNE